MKNTKKVLSVVLAVIMVLTMLSVGAFAADEALGTVEAITAGVAVNSDDPANLVVTNESVVTLNWYPTDLNVGRWQDGWWIGVKVVAPADVDVDAAKYVIGGVEKSFKVNRDSKDGDAVQYITCWLPITPDSLRNFAAAGENLTWVYTFKWDGETEQNVVASIDPAKVDLNKDGEHVHVFLDTTVAPTCTEEGYDSHFCVCGAGEKTNEVEALGHIDEDDNGYCDVCEAFICDCLCHKVASTFYKVLYKIVSIFWHLFHIKYTCKCGKVHVF